MSEWCQIYISKNTLSLVYWLTSKKKKVKSGLSTTCFVSSSGLGSTTPVTSMIDYETDPGFSVCGDGVLDRPSITTNCIFWPCSLITHTESAVFRLCCSVTQCYQMCIGGKLVSLLCGTATALFFKRTDWSLEGVWGELKLPWHLFRSAHLNIYCTTGRWLSSLWQHLYTCRQQWTCEQSNHRQLTSPVQILHIQTFAFVISGMP